MLVRPVLPLNEASRAGKLEVANLLLDYVADVNVSTKLDSSILQAAKQEHEGVVRLLLEAWADHNPYSFQDRSPFAKASRPGHADVVQLLLKNYAMIDEQTRSGTALLAAAERGNTPGVRFLLECGADYEAALNFHQLDSNALGCHLLVLSCTTVFLE